jgi:hypothetical protein
MFGKKTQDPETQTTQEEVIPPPVRFFSATDGVLSDALKALENQMNEYIKSFEDYDFTTNFDVIVDRPSENGSPMIIAYGQVEVM